MASTVDAVGEPIPTSSVLMASSKHIATKCRIENMAFLNCKKKDPNPEKCLDKGQEVTRCVLSLLKGLHQSCTKEMDAYAGCMYYHTNEFELCRKEQQEFEKACPWNEYRFQNQGVRFISFSVYSLVTPRGFPKMRHVKEESSCIIEQAIDLNSAVEELHRLSSQEINKLLKDSDNFIIPHLTEKGLIQIDMEKLACCLPLHLIAVLVSPDRGDTRLIYLLRGFRLLHSLCDLASRQTRLEQILLEDMKVTEQILDLVFYMLVVLARYEQDHHTADALPLLHSALVACSFHILTGCVSSQWQDLVQVLIAHPKVDVFMDVAFDAVCLDIRFLQIKLSVLKPDFSCEKSSPSDAEQTLHNICHQCEASLQFLHSLCQQKLFRERLLRNKELCKNGGILFLARTVLKLEIPHSLDSSTVVAAISRLKSKILSILLQLCETETISYLDEVARSPSSMQLAKTVALEILGLLKTAFDGVPKQLDSICGSLPRGVVLLNSMRLIDIFSDDSNFRSFIMVNITQVLAEIFSLPQEEFLFSWCSAELPIREEDATLEYVPFVAAGLVSVLVSTGFGTYLPTSDLMNETENGSSFILNNIPQASYAQQRTSLLVKIIANLHCFVPNICEEQERNLFFNKFLESLQIELPKSSPGISFTRDTQKAARVCKNLGSLVDHAGSLIPNFLNEEDVQLLSVFVKQLESLVTSAKPEGNPIQEQVQENTFEASLCWEKLSNHGANDHHQEAQSTVGCASSLARKGDPKAPEVASDFNDKNGSLREGISDNSTFREVDQFNIASRGLELPHDVLNLDGSRRNNKGGTSGSALEPFREIDKDVRNVETGGLELSSARGKSSVVSHMPENGDCSKLAGHTRESSLAGLQENYTETMQCEDRQRRKRKRNIMNDRQITLIELALLDEPEMQRHPALLQTWADKLSVHGSELTPSQLKNWLNNRKAKLARAAREALTPSEGETAFPEKSGGMGMVHFYDSSESPSEDLYAPSTARGGSSTSTPKSGGGILRTCGSETSEIASTDFVDFAAQQNMLMNCPSLRYVRREPGQYVSLVEEGDEVGRGKVYQVEGKWHGKNLEEAGTCVVDVLDLKVERRTRLQHPSEAAGSTFDEAEAKNGVMRVAWDVNKILLLPQ
ncbi:hypothetical protein NE237_012034 [Protea cynaroides]|uniref:Homeobox domain-containing protein n=1 Tax=Protea cynaroides TaxID=273540 RepID=A0A9Q0GW25_9MAGN|nr:hypothetical protein NE237_012034 [Protea cynaroides]